MIAPTRLARLTLPAAAALALLCVGCQRVGGAAEPNAAGRSPVSSIQKVRALSEQAEHLCGSHSPKDRRAGSRAARKAADAARSAFATRPADRKPSDGWELLAPAAEAVAECQGASAAKDFVNAAVDHNVARIMLTRLADKLAASGQAVLAEALAPAPDPNDAEDLVDAARRLIRDGRPRRARIYALQANDILHATAAKPGQPNLVQDAALDRQLTEVMADVGEYQDAIYLVGLQAPGDQEEDLRALIFHLIDAHDRKGVDQVMPIVITLFAYGPASALEGAGDMAEVVRRLALAGFRAEALQANQALDERRGLLPVWQKLRLRADLGDVDGALAAADRLGPLTQPASPLAGARVETSSSRADALAAIATDLAETGRIADALKAEAPLDASPPAAVADSRDFALATIAEAQARAGQSSDAQQTLARIYQPAVRAATLAKLQAGPSR